MTTIGYGDFYPNSDGARYVESADARHHQVYVWCMGAFPLYYTNCSSHCIYTSYILVCVIFLYTKCRISM